MTQNLYFFLFLLFGVVVLLGIRFLFEVVGPFAKRKDRRRIINSLIKEGYFPFSVTDLVDKVVTADLNDDMSLICNEFLDTLSAYVAILVTKESLNLSNRTDRFESSMTCYILLFLEVLKSASKIIREDQGKKPAMNTRIEKIAEGLNVKDLKRYSRELIQNMTDIWPHASKG